MINDFISGYLECALWSSNNDNGEDNPPPLDQSHSTSDLHPDTLEKMKTDCQAFYDANKKVFIGSMPVEYAGHDFWLTRNRHGAGFWDREYLSQNQQSALTSASHAFGEYWLYVGDDNLIHGSK